MKKTTVLFLCVTMLCTLLGAFFTSCGITTKIPASIEVVDAQTRYYLNDVIDYDSIKAKIVYDDETTKDGTVKSLKMTVTEKADLSKVGETSYTVSYGDFTFTVTITVLDRSTTVTALEVVDPQDTYIVGDEIDYDALKVKVTYANGTIIEDTVSELEVEVKTGADLSKEGVTSYTLSLKGVEETVDLEVLRPYFQSLNLPIFYQNYLTKSKNRGKDEVEKQGDFRITGEVYEVGNVNKFLFPVTLTAEGVDSEDVRTITSPVVSVNVYEKTSKDGTYRALTAAESESVVIIDGSSYKFTDASVGKYYKLEITPDEDVYEVDENIAQKDKTESFECYIVGGGYNVYDQIGLSVMNDLSSKHWTEIWKCDIDENYKLTSRPDSLKLEADDKPLCEYVGNIDWAILHTSFAIDADQLPSYYFWTEKTEGYSTAKDALPKIDGLDLEPLLLGSLRDGIANGDYFTITNIPSGKDRLSSQLGYSINGQKAFFSTYRVSVSGNYNGITVPSEKSEGGRSLYSVVAYNKDSISGRMAPSPHWHIFQMFQSDIEENYAKLTLKNVAMTGNSGQVTDTEFAPGRMMMTNCFGKDINLTNVVANSFYTNIVCDGFTTSKQTNGVKVDSVKLYDAYSNMFYSWRANVNVTNSDMIGSGGPLFILVDGSNTSDEPAKCVLTVDQKSKLQAYATGAESWYKLNNVQTIVTMIQGNMEPAFNKMRKTVTFNKNADNTYSPATSSAKGTYVNIIAAMICEPSDIFAGKSDKMLKVRGIYQTVDKDGKVVEKFDTRNNYVQAISANAENNAKKFAPIFQHGDNFAFTNDLMSLQTLDFTNYPNVEEKAFDETTDGFKWATDTHDKIGIYISAGILAKGATSNAPYFGVVLGSAQYN